MEGLILFIIVVVWLGSNFIWKKLISPEREALLAEMFPEKDLLFIDSIKVAKGIDIKLYDLKRDVHGNIDRDSYEFVALASKINPEIEIKMDGKDDDGDFEVSVELSDFRNEKRLELEYIEMIGLITNFNLQMFIFEGEERFKLLNIDDGIMKQVKDYVDEVIKEVFEEIIEMYKEDENGAIFADVVLDAL